MTFRQIQGQGWNKLDLLMSEILEVFPNSYPLWVQKIWTVVNYWISKLYIC